MVLVKLDYWLTALLTRIKITVFKKQSYSLGHFFVLKRQQTEKPIKQQPTRPRTTTTAFETATTTNGSHLKLTFDAAVNIHSGGSFLLSLTHTLTPPLSFVSHSLSLSHTPPLSFVSLSLSFSNTKTEVGTRTHSTSHSCIHAVAQWRQSHLCTTEGRYTLPPSLSLEPVHTTYYTQTRTLSVPLYLSPYTLALSFFTDKRRYLTFR